jgi:hypothetical protein
MPIEPWSLTKLLGPLFSGFRTMGKRRQAQRWVGNWEAYNLQGRDLAQPMSGAGPTIVSLAPWWKFSAKLTFSCHDTDAHGQPTRHQTGHIKIDPDDVDAATRSGRYVKTAEVYEQRLTMLDKDTVLVIPIPSHSTLGDVYRKHGWRRKG